MLFKKKLRWALGIGCICTIASLGLFGGGASQRTVQIGVKVEIAKLACTSWNQDQEAGVKRYALSEFHRRVSKHFKHWDFIPQDHGSPKTTLTLAIIEKYPSAVVTGPNDLFFQVRLDIGNPGSPGHEAHELVWQPWLDSRTLDAAFPNSLEATRHIGRFLEDTFPDIEGSRKIHVKSETVQEFVPLALNPVWHDPDNKTFVLPLTKSRYLHLEKSVFQFCRQGDLSEQCLDANGLGEWEKPDPNTTDDPNANAELIVKIEGDTNNWNPDNYKPILIFLKEYKKTRRYHE
jgi:hypothetical protein